MASSEKTKLPNLKICIDNDESESDDDRLSLTDEPQISIEDGEEDKRIAKPVHDDIIVSDSPGSERVLDEEDVQFNVYLSKLDSKPTEVTSNRQTRRYENKDGNFVTGIDFTEEISAEKLQERAKRFGIDYKPEPAVNLQELYESLGLKSEDLSRRDERGIRLDTIHLRGVDEMNTKDVFNYFKEFAAGSCEWIDDESCNIVWLDKMTAARAMLKLSRSYEQVMAEYGIKEPTKQKSNKTKKKTEPDAESKMEEDVMDQSEDAVKESGEERNEEKMDEDNDELDLTEDKLLVDKETQEKKLNKEEKMEDEGIEEGEITESDSEPEVPSHNNIEFSRIPWPPGKWRLGVPYKDKNNYLFLRFATKADVKLPGAEKRSKYYQKYGNPNYGGRVGLLSRSMKQKLRGRRRNGDFDSLGVPDSGIVVSDRNQVSYEDDLFSDTIAPVEVEEIDIYSTSQKLGKNSKKLPKKDQSEDEEEEMNRSEEENDFPMIERVTSTERGDNDRGTDSDVDEEELERLLGAKEKKPVMRMYADDLEEKQKVHRQRKMVGALTIVADAKKKVKKVQDARQLITGVDLRAALQEKKMNRQHRSPISWKHSRSRSLSPDFEKNLDEDMNFKIITPMHMTIENEVLSESEDEKDLTPEPEPVQEVNRKKRVNSPVGTKSKMDELEKPKDVRSRLSQKAREDLDVRIAQRSSNNVKSRLSKRVSPDKISPVRYSDTRISRVRRSRSHDQFRSKFNRSRSPDNRNRRPVRRRSRTRSPIWRRNNRYRSPVRNRSPLRHSPIRRFNRSRSRSPINRRQARSNIRSRSPIHRHINDRTRSGRDARSRLGRKSRSPTDTEDDSEDEQIPPSRMKMTVDASSSSSSSSSSSDSSSDNSSSSSDSSSSSSSSDSSSSSSDSDDSDSDASERSAIRNKKTQRVIDRPRSQQDKFTSSHKQHLSHSKSNGPRRKARRPQRPLDD